MTKTVFHQPKSLAADRSPAPHFHSPLSAEGSVGVRADTGIRSPHYGDIQRHHQEWLIRKAQQLSLRLGINEHSAAEGSKSSLAEGVGGGGSTTTKLSSFEEKPEPPTKRDGSAAAAVGRKTQEVGLKAQEVEERQRLLRGAEGTAAVERTELEDRIDRANIGVRLWGETYVPPIEPERRQELIDKWTGTTWSMPENAAQVGSPGGFAASK